jgi:nucleotide-binding universal stress UspA family protein
MAKRILIPLDGSKIGEAALHYVGELISSLGAVSKVEVILFQAVSPPTKVIEVEGEDAQVPITEKDKEEIKEKAVAYLDGAGEALRRKGAIVKTKVVVRVRGLSSAVEIIRAEHETNADLVAMSTHGRRGLSRWAFGSVTEKVLRGGKLPVLVVRAGKEAENKQSK